MEIENLEIMKKERAGCVETETLLCKFCHTEMVTDLAKKPYNCIHEHVSSGRHLRVKTGKIRADEERDKQPSIIAFASDSMSMKNKQREQSTTASELRFQAVRALSCWMDHS